MKKRQLFKLMGYTLKIGTIVACPPLAIFIGLNESLNLIKRKKIKDGTWTEKEENKMLAMKMALANPSAATKLLGKATFKEKTPEIYNIITNLFASSMMIEGDITTVSESIEKSVKK